MIAPALGTADLSYLLLLLEDCERNGVAREGLLEALGFAPGSPGAEQGRVPIAAVYRLFDLLTEASGNPWYGLDLASRVPTEAGKIGLVRVACANRPTLGAAIETFGQLIPLIDTTNVLCVIESELGVHLGWLPSADGRVPNPQAMLFGLGAMYQAAVRLSGRTFAPVRLRVPSPPVEDLTTVRRVLNTDTVEFCSDQCQLILGVECLALPFASADEGASDLMIGYAMKLLDELPEAAWLSRVRVAIGESLRRDRTLLPELAATLGVSQRTLQRRLGEAGTSHQEQVDFVRKELALRYVSGTGQPIKQIARLTGYKDPQAFSRAFQRWYGTTPMDHRSKLLERSSPGRVRKA